MNSITIYENLEKIGNSLGQFDIPTHDSNKIEELISNSFGLLQHQDLHRQKIERVVNFVCDKNNIDKSQYNIASSAKSIDSDDNMSEDELEALIKQMQA